MTLLKSKSPYIIHYNFLWLWEVRVGKTIILSTSNAMPIPITITLLDNSLDTIRLFIMDKTRRFFSFIVKKIVERRGNINKIFLRLALISATPSESITLCYNRRWWLFIKNFLFCFVCHRS
uniref:Uncharacterized protein n=1 Tax=Sphaerobolus stellatus TaxID=68786 RepID=A0A7D4VFZ7_9AGAM|nr:hypothetical protein [Sphaerobolus stellatus]